MIDLPIAPNPLNQAFVRGGGRCTVMPAKHIAAIRTLDHRVKNGRWSSMTARRPL